MQGMAIVANKFSHVAAVPCSSPQAAAAARSAHGANVLCLGGRTTAASDVAA